MYENIIHYNDSNSLALLKGRIYENRHVIDIKRLLTVLYNLDLNIEDEKNLSILKLVIAKHNLLREVVRSLSGIYTKSKRSFHNDRTREIFEHIDGYESFIENAASHLILHNDILIFPYIVNSSIKLKLLHQCNCVVVASDLYTVHKINTTIVHYDEESGEMFNVDVTIKKDEIVTKRRGNNIIIPGLTGPHSYNKVPVIPIHFNASSDFFNPFANLDLVEYTLDRCVKNAVELEKVLHSGFKAVMAIDAIPQNSVRMGNSVITAFTTDRKAVSGKQATVKVADLDYSRSDSADAERTYGNDKRVEYGMGDVALNASGTARIHTAEEKYKIQDKLERLMRTAETGIWNIISMYSDRMGYFDKESKKLGLITIFYNRSLYKDGEEERGFYLTLAKNNIIKKSQLYTTYIDPTISEDEADELVKAAKDFNNELDDAVTFGNIDGEDNESTI